MFQAFNFIKSRQCKCFQTAIKDCCAIDELMAIKDNLNLKITFVIFSRKIIYTYSLVVKYFPKKGEKLYR